LINEITNEQRNVVAAVTERRDAEHDDLEPIVEVFTKLALFDDCVQIAVGRSD
jgi:hypothetical protein